MNQRQLFQLLRLITRYSRRGKSRRWVLLVGGLLVTYVALQPYLKETFGWNLPGTTAAKRDSDAVATPGDAAILSAYKDHKSNVIVQSQATIVKVLKDDLEGDRHQKMILRLASGHTLLLAHNIDLAPRVPASEGDSIGFRGEYEYSGQGGVIHWTHHDPRKRHDEGWLEWEGKKYQ